MRTELPVFLWNHCMWYRAYVGSEILFWVPANYEDRQHLIRHKAKVAKLAIARTVSMRFNLTEMS